MSKITSRFVAALRKGQVLTALSLTLILVLVSGSVTLYHSAHADTNLNPDNSVLSMWHTSIDQQYYYKLVTYTKDWQKGMYYPDITIYHNVSVVDKNTGTNIAPNSTLSQGQQIRFVFPAYAYSDIYWFGNAQSNDSPYGDWSVNADGPALDANGNGICADKDYVADTNFNGGTQSVYIPFMVNPPARSISGTSGLDCSPMSSTALGQATMDCTVTADTGTINPNFHFDSTYGKFYYRWKGIYPVSDCYGDNRAMSTDKNSDATIQIPAVDVPFSFNVNSSNHQPSAPTLSCPSSAVAPGADVSVQLSATDPDNDQVRYGVDWNNGMPHSVTSGWSDYMPSGTSYTFTKTGGFSSNGVYTVAAVAEDSKNAASTWSTCDVTVASSDQPDLTADPVTATVTGSTVSLAVLVKNIGQADAAASKTLFQKANDSTGAGAADLFAVDTSAIAKSSSTSVTKDTTTSVLPVGKWVRACADKSSAGDTGAIPESNENNNCGDWAQVTDGGGGGDSVSCSANVSKITSLPATVTFTATPHGTVSGPYAWTATLGGSYGTSASAVETFDTSTSNGSYSMMVSASGKSDTCTVDVDVVGTSCTPGIVKFDANPDRVRNPGSTQLSWTVTGTDDCVISSRTNPNITTIPGGSSCSAERTGTFDVTGITTQTVFTLTCGGASKDKIVNVIPKFSQF